MKQRVKKGIGKLVGAGLCVVMLGGCTQVQSIEDAGQQNGVEVSETGQGAVEQDAQESGATVQSESVSVQESILEEVTDESEISGSQASIAENRIVVRDTLYDDVLNPIGTILSRQITIYCDAEQETEVFQFYVTWPEIDVSFDGADFINEQMLAYVDGMDVMYTQDEQWLGCFEGIQGSFSDSFDGFSYRDDHYISFMQSEYIYEGGAHGMPYREPFTFHLQSGERLWLSDVIGNGEEELKEIVVRYFGQKIKEAPDEYWEDAEQIVRENTTLESNFVLTPEGIMFYFIPYDIAPYAAGFPEVIVPYEEFDMKIHLEQ